MFWNMAGLSTASPVEAILDKENFTLEELLDEDEIIQECKALNERLISFLRGKGQVKQLIQYIVEEAPEDCAKQRTFKFPFIACEIFTCDVDIILEALVEDEELMHLLFSFLDPECPHSTRLAGYFSKVVICLLVRKTASLINYMRAHQNIINKLVDLIGITSIMEVLIRLIDLDEHLYTDDVESLQWLEDINVLDMIADKFSSSDCPEVHANAAETLCTIIRYAPPGLASKISSPSFIGKLFHHALEESRPESVLVNLLSVCICLLYPKRLASGLSYMYGHQMSHRSGISAVPEIVQGMLSRLGDLLKLLDPSPENIVLLTTYGKLQPPLGKHRLKIVEFIAVLVGVSSEVAEKELISLGAFNRIFMLFFEYPYNNFLHHHVELIVTSCLESKNPRLVSHLLHDCNLVKKILEAENNSTLAVNEGKQPTVPSQARCPPRIGNIGHVTRIANKLVQRGNNDSSIREFLQGNSEWVDWQSKVLDKRNAVENVLQWACGRPTTIHRDSDDDDYQDQDFDVAALANNLSRAFQYGINNNGDVNEDTYFDGEFAEKAISSLRSVDDMENGTLSTDPIWSAFEDKSTESSSNLSASHHTTDQGCEDEVVEAAFDELQSTSTNSDDSSKGDNNSPEFVADSSSDEQMTEQKIPNNGDDLSEALKRHDLPSPFSSAADLPEVNP